MKKPSPFVQLVQRDAKLKASLDRVGFAPSDDTLEAWAEFEESIRRGGSLELGGEYSIFDGDLSFVQFFPKTTFLMVGVTKKTSLEPLRALKALENIQLYGQGVLDLSVFSELKKLSQLEVKGFVVNSIAPLRALKSLKRLALFQGAVDDLSPLAGLALKHLYLPAHRVTSLQPLAGSAKTLTYLQVPNNQVSDVSVLKGMTLLTFLGLKGNSVRDVSAIASCTSLTTLYLEGNPATDTSSLRALKKLETKDFKIAAGSAPKLSAALKKRLSLLAKTKECSALLERLLGRLNAVDEKKGVIRFDADDNSVIAVELGKPVTKIAKGLPASFVEVVSKVGPVFIDAGRPGVSGPQVGVNRIGGPLCDIEWDGEDRTRFSEFAHAGQNWFVWDTKKKNALGEPGIVFFSHEGALSPNNRFPMQDKVAFGTGGFLLRALAFRVFSKEKDWRGCGWG